MGLVGADLDVVERLVKTGRLDFNFELVQVLDLLHVGAQIGLFDHVLELLLLLVGFGEINLMSGSQRFLAAQADVDLKTALPEFVEQHFCRLVVRIQNRQAQLFAHLKLRTSSPLL